MKLGEILTHRKGYITIDDSQVYKLCRVQLHRKGVVLREAILGEKIKTKKQQVCKRGDFIVAEMDAKVGGYGFISDDLEGAIVSSHYFLFELNEKKVDQGYFTILVKFGFFQSQIKAVGSTNYAAVRPSDVLNWEVPVPGLKEQEQIKNRIETVACDKDILVSEMDTQLSLLTALRQSILTEAVQGRLTAQWRRDNPAPEHARELLHRIAAEKARLIREKKIGKEKPLPPVTEEEMPYVVPEGWVWCRADEVVSFNGGVAKGKELKGNMIQSPYLRVANVQRGHLDLRVIKEIVVSESDYKKYQLQVGDLLMIEGGDPDKVGRCAIWRNEIPNCIHQNHIFRVRTYRAKELSVEFLETFFNSPVCQAYYGKSAKQTTNLASINKSQMRMTPIVLPPLSEQHAIVQKVTTLLAYCDELEQQVRQSKADVEQLMQAVLGEVFGTGS